jgi:curved DNA-binding protein CbpA
MPINDYYLVLEVSRDATRDQIRERFRELARERHPDRFPSAEKARAELEFQRLTQAASVLLDPDKRRGHDIELSQPHSPERQEEVRLVRMLLQRGKVAYNSRNFVEAVESFDRATTEDPNNAAAWYYLARACSHSRRWLSRGVTAILAAVKLEPTNADFLQLAGDLCARAKMTTRAERYYVQAESWGADPAEIRAALDRLEEAGRGKERSK